MAFETLSRVTPVLLFSLASHHALLCSRYSRCAGHVRVFLLRHAPRHLMAFAFAVSPPGILASSSQSRCFSVFRSPLHATHSRKRSLISPVDFIFPGYRYLSSPGLFLYVLVTSSVMAGTVCSVHCCLSSPLWSVRVMVGAQ